MKPRGWHERTGIETPLPGAEASRAVHVNVSLLQVEPSTDSVSVTSGKLRSTPRLWQRKVPGTSGWVMGITHPQSSLPGTGRHRRARVLTAGPIGEARTRMGDAPAARAGSV